jgi:iron complex transport system ATP-binding protein
MADARLVVDGVSVSRGPRRVVDGVSFSAPAGALTVLLGPNGAGKSTLLKAIAGVLPYDGVVRVDGADAGGLDPQARARAVAYVPQHSALDAPLPVRDVVELGRYPHGGGGLRRGRQRADDDAAVARALERTDLVALADRPFNALSYGERRRTLLARALATGAGVLLLDEPTAALDVGHALALLAVLRELATGGAAVLLVLHQLQEAAEVADHAVLLDRGRCVRTGAPREVIASEPVRAVYGVDIVPAAQFACRLPQRRA